VIVLVLSVAAFGLGAGLYACWSPASPPGPPEATAAEPEKRPGRDRTPEKKTFENEFGYSWWKEPQDVSDSVAAHPTVVGRWTVTVTHGGGKGEPVISEMLVPAEDGNLLIIQNQAFHIDQEMSGDQSVQFTTNSKSSARPVLFDADGKRYLPRRSGAMGGGGNETYLRYMVFQSLASDLPLNKVHYVGIEYIPPEGQKAIDARAAERARAAGLQVVPPGRRSGEPYAFTLTAIDGKQVRSADLRGNQIVIHCWSTKTHENEAYLRQLYKEHRAEGLVMIGICLDNQDAESVRKFCAEQGMTWPQVLVRVPDEKTRTLWSDATNMHEGWVRVIDRKGNCAGDCGENNQFRWRLHRLLGLDPPRLPRNR
jgi:hypothetical protein